MNIYTKGNFAVPASELQSMLDFVSKALQNPQIYPSVAENTPVNIEYQVNRWKALNLHH